ncbi:MAG: hypothetical protein DYG84_11735 [Candidatus Brocadia sp. AMX3]|nr:hypothetical protein [Candidatus Brocadia sp. AMX3]
MRRLMDEHSPSRTNNDSPANSMNIVDMLNQMGISDPRLQMLAEFMKHQNPPQDKRIPAEEEKIKLKRIIGRYKQLKHENMVLMEKNDALASALGACPYCWGEDVGCEICNGKGVPGAYVPNTSAFVEYVLPAVRKLRLFRGKEQGVPADSGAETKVNAKSQHTNINQKEV